MNRQQMIRRAADILPYHHRVNPPSGECSCGHVTPLGRMTSQHVAEAVFDEVLPQVTTVAELEALPVGSSLLGRDGGVWRRRASTVNPWWGTGGGYGDSLADLAEISERFLSNEGPLTVVWQPS